MRRIGALFLSIVTAGCASGPIPFGPDTYMLTTRGWTMMHPATSAEESALREAGEFCAGQQKFMMPDSLRSSGPNPAVGTPAQAQFVFRCLDEGDPDLQRPVMRRTPDVLIEHR